MKIERERPCSRLAYGITAPLSVRVNGGAPVRAHEWSQLGVVLARTAVPAGDAPLALTLLLDFQGFEIAVPVAATRDSEDDETATLLFEGLEQRGREVLAHFVEGVVRGRMSHTDETILSIDAPVDPISTEPDSKGPAPGPARRAIWPAVMTCIYLLLGLTVFGYVGVLLYASFVRLEVQTAVLTRPLEVVAMPVDGLVTEVAVAEGAEVNAGDVLLRLHDPALAERIDRARIALSEADAALTRLEGRVAVERVRLADYQLINRTDRDIARAELAAHEQEVATLTRARDRALALHAEGHVAAARVEEAEAALALAEARSAAARLMTERTDALHTVAAARHHNGREFIVDLDLLALDLEEARAARDARAAELGALLALEGAQTVRAPWAGRVVDLLHQDGARLLRGAPLLALEREGAPIVEAWLTQEEVLEVGLGDTALIFLPALDRTLEARITRIDRTSGFVDEQRSQYTWRGPEDRSARVLLELEGAAAELPGGLPAITLFRRRNPSALREAVLGATDV